jgi:site-specific DNA-methyltransferase (cytosine-N4-specific)
MQTLIAIAEEADYNVCQQFIWENIAKLPGPAPYVTTRRIRLKDSHTNIWWYSPRSKSPKRAFLKRFWGNISLTNDPASSDTKQEGAVKSSHSNVWWFSPTVRPKANNKAILTPYKEGQKKLMAKGTYNHGSRPSEHNISVDGFVTNNGGAIRGSTFAIDSSEDDALNSVIRMSNTQRDKAYYDWCTRRELTMHPARMPVNLAKIFIEFLTEKGDLVLDPFGGSCTTGQAAEELNRKWIAIEMDKNYLEGAKGRFQNLLK